jgi:uncharacterized protein YjiS (DUF1127 family)
MLKFFKKAAQRAHWRRRMMLDFQTLQAMDERMLRDIGVSRGDIDEAQRRVRWMV